MWLRRGSVLVAWLLAASVVVVNGYEARAASAAESSSFIRLDRAFELDELGVSNPAGLAFIPAGNAFHIVRAPGSGEAAPTMTDVVELTPFEERAGSAVIAAQISDPANMTFDNRHGRLLLFSAATNHLIEVQADTDGRLLPGTLVRHDATAFGLGDARGMSVDPTTGQIFILDRVEPRIVRVEPAADGTFDAAVISSVDLASSGPADPSGIALDPTTGHLHVVSVGQQALYELTQSGDLVTTRDLSEAELVNPQALVFAPSGDQTDDEAQMSLYLADAGASSAPRSPGRPFGAQELTTVDSTDATAGGASGSGQLLEFSFVDSGAPIATADFTSMLIQEIEAFNWSPPSPDSSGVVYLPASDTLMVSDGEVNEMPIYAGANVYESTLTGTLIDTFTTLDFGNNEPTGISVNPANRHLFISRDTPPKEIHELDPGPDGAYDTADDVVTSVVTADFGATDPEGVTYAEGSGDLFIADGLNDEIYRLDAGPNGIFDGVPPAGDDVVEHQFDTFVLGLEDPEGIAYNPDNGNLYLAGKTRNIGTYNFDTLLEVTVTGALVQTIDVSAANPGRQNPRQKLSGLGYGPSSVNSNSRVIYIADRGEDNNNDPNENDGRIYEMTLPGNPAAPPVAVDDSAVTAQETPVIVNVAANDSDPNGDLNPASANDTCANGSTGCDGAANGMLVSNGNGTITYTPNPGFTGPTDSFVYEICDDGLLCDTATVTITVTVPNDPPVANDDIATTPEDMAVTVDVDANDTDVDENLAPASTNTDCATCSVPSDGVLTNLGNGSFTYTPNPDFNGGDSFVYEICDTLGACDTATVTITVTPVADAPVAVNDGAATSEATAVTVDVAANDTDVDGDLVATSANHTCVNGSTGCDGAGAGTLVSNGNGTITYTPIAGFTGSDSFVYEICDTGGLCDTATVNITVSGARVLYVSSTSGGTVGGMRFADEDILVFDESSGSWTMFFDGSDVGLGGGGQEVDALHVSADGSVLLSLGADGTVPDVGSVQDHDILRFVFDPSSTEAVTVGTFEIYLNGEDVGLAASGEDVDAIGFDPDGRLVVSTRGSYSAGGVSGPDEDLIVLVAGPPQQPVWEVYLDASVVGLSTSSEDTNAVWLDGNGDVHVSVRGTFDVTGLTGDGDDVFVCTPSSPPGVPIVDCAFSLAWDGDEHGFGSEVLNGLMVTGAGGQAAPPVAVDDSVVTSQDTPVTFDVTLNDSDPNGDLDETSTNTDCGTCSVPANGGLTNHFDGTFTYAPNLGFTGDDSFVYEICDMGELCDTATVSITVTVANDPPVAGDDVVSTPEDTPVTFDVVTSSDSDPNGNLDPATTNTDCVTCSVPSDGGLTNHLDGTFTYAPNADFNGGDSFVYEICDTLGLCDTATVTITVTPVPDAPVAVNDGVSTAEGTAVTFDVAANDTDVDEDLVPASANTDCATCSVPANGGLVPHFDGTFTYAPNPGFTGSDSFVYEICDTGGLCDTATVNITVSGGGLYYVSFDVNTTVPGIGGEVRDEDIVSYDPATGSWAMHFDASDVGLNSSDLNAFHVRADGSILMSFSSAITVPGLTGGPAGSEIVEDADVFVFEPTSTGDVTAGSFSFLFDGSDEGLTLSAHDLTGVYEFGDGRLAFSTRGSVTVDGVSARDEDVLLFTPTSLGENTAGTWELYFDGSDVGLGVSGDDMDGLSFDTTGELIYSTRAAHTAAGTPIDDEDLTRFSATAYGDTTAGVSTLELDLSTIGIDPAVDTDGIHLG